MEGEELVAVCGLYCGACRLYRAWHDDRKETLEEIRSARKLSLEALHCDGCLSQGNLGPHCPECEIRFCAEEKPGVTRCSDCPDFPCNIITAFNNDGVRHHAEALENVRRQREVGIEEWLEEQYERWRCMFCGVSLDWYDRTCYRCGAQQPDQLPSVPGKQK